VHILKFAFFVPTVSKLFWREHSWHTFAYLRHKKCIINFLISPHMYCIAIYNNTIICTEFRKFKSIILQQTVWHTFFFYVLKHMVYLLGKIGIDFTCILLSKSKNNPKSSNKK